MTNKVLRVTTRSFNLTMTWITIILLGVCLIN